MTLPIRWAVVRELRTGAPAIMARLVHNGQPYQATMVLPKNPTPMMVKLAIAAMMADFQNTVGGAT